METIREQDEAEALCDEPGRDADLTGKLVSIVTNSQAGSTPL
jgi:hypothetical protein